MQSAESEALLKEYTPKVVSKTRRKRIDRDFNQLTDYVFEQEDWPFEVELAACVKVLHRYRNDAYHKDKVQPDVLEAALVIYFYLVAQLLQHRKGIVWVIDVPPPGVLELLESEALEDGGDPIRYYSSDHYGHLMAERFLADFVPAHADISAALSRHMLGRLRAIDRDLKEIADFHKFPLLHPEFALRLVRRTEEEWHSSGPPADFWTRENSVARSDLAAWKASAVSLERVDDALDALRTFANQEETIAAFEERASELATRVDHQIQHNIDLARGK